MSPDCPKRSTPSGNDAVVPDRAEPRQRGRVRIDDGDEPRLIARGRRAVVSMWEVPSDSDRATRARAAPATSTTRSADAREILGELRVRLERLGNTGPQATMAISASRSGGYQPVGTGQDVSRVSSGVIVAHRLRRAAASTGGDTPTRRRSSCMCSRLQRSISQSSSTYAGSNAVSPGCPMPMSGV